MKAVDIAQKDLSRSLRSAFLLVFMFGIPLLVTGMFALMFGGMAGRNTANSGLPPATKVVIANLDRGSPSLSQAMAAFTEGNGDQPEPPQSLGAILVTELSGPAFTSLIEISQVPNEAAARQAVSEQQAGVAIIIPVDFSEAYVSAGGKANLEMVQDPTLSVGPSIVHSILEQISDQFSGLKIAVTVGNPARQDPGQASVGTVVQEFLSAQPRDPDTAWVEWQSPAASGSKTTSLGQIVGPIMSGMMIFFAFFTGGTTAQTILKEAEEGTLARLFTTPTARATILNGKFLAVALTVLVQIAVLLLASALIFQIQWGDWWLVGASALGIVACSATFGLFLTSLLKNSRQGGAVYGGLMTVAGMVGMMPVFTGAMPTWSQPASLVSLIMPQGWAVRAMQLCMGASPAAEIYTNLAVLLALSLVFFTIAVLRFQKRFDWSLV